MKNIADYFAYCAVRLLGCLPMWLLYAIAALVGRVMWWTNSSSAKASRINLMLCYPDLSAEEIDKLAKQSIMEMAKVMVESVAVWCKSFDKAFDHRIVDIKGKYLLDDAMRENKSIVLISSHLGSYEILYQYIHRITPNAAILYRPLKLKRLGEFVLKGRGKEGGRMMPSNREGITQYCKVAKESGGIVAIAGDLVPSRERGDFVPFFATEALTPHFPTDLVKDANALALCLHMVRVENNHFCVVLEEFHEDIYSDDKKLAAQAMTKGIEKRIAANPEQYAWSYKRFKRTRDGSKPYD